MVTDYTAMVLPPGWTATRDATGAVTIYSYFSPMAVTAWHTRITNATTSGVTTGTLVTADPWGAWNAREAASSERAPAPRNANTNARREWLREEARRRELEGARARCVREEWQRAGERAEALLRANLTPEQLHDLLTYGAFHVKAAGPEGERHYRIARGTHGNIHRMSASGAPVERLCVQPRALPTADCMLAQKLWLETNEAELRAIAGITPL